MTEYLPLDSVTSSGWNSHPAEKHSHERKIEGSAFRTNWSRVGISFCTRFQVVSCQLVYHDKNVIASAASNH